MKERRTRTAAGASGSLSAWLQLPANSGGWFLGILAGVADPGVEVKRRVARPVGAPAQCDVTAAFEHTVEDRLGEIRIVQHGAPL